MISDHIGTIARLGVEKELAKGLLKAVDLDSPLMMRPIGIVRRENEPMSPAVMSFVSIMEDIGRRRSEALKR